MSKDDRFEIGCAEPFADTVVSMYSRPWRPEMGAAGIMALLV
jgi:hypothetical protein